MVDWATQKFGARQLARQLLAFGAADTVKTITLETGVRGTLAEIDIEIPVWTNAPTCIVTLERSDGTVAWTGAAVSKGGAITYYAQFPDRVIQGGETLKATLSLAPGGSGDNVYITPFIR
jgi:hypothetical protein